MSKVLTPAQAVARIEVRGNNGVVVLGAWLP